MTKPLIAIAALGSILAGCSEFQDPVETYKCSDANGRYYTVIYDSTTKRPQATGNGGVSLCGGDGCDSTLLVTVVGEVITFIVNDYVWILDRGASTLRFRREGLDRGKHECKTVPNGTR